MSVLQNVPRWIAASVAKHFDTILSDLDVYIEGQEMPLDTDASRVEVRIDGPWYREVSKNVVQVRSEINVLVMIPKSETNLYEIYTQTGKVADAFTNIPIYKYGNEAGDDESYYGCFKILPLDDLRERVEIAHFGQIDPTIKLLQATVEGHFEMMINLA